MGSVGQVSRMSISDFKIEEKKWDVRERQNLENAINFMSSNFGDIKDLIGTIYRRSLGSNTGGEYDMDGLRGRGRATYFATSMYASEERIIHEFTHAVTEQISSYYRALGYDTRSDVLSAMRDEIRTNLGLPERKYDGRKWSDRPEEYLSNNMELFGDWRYKEGGRNAKNAEEALRVIKKWYNRTKRLKSKGPKPTRTKIVLE